MHKFKFGSIRQETSLIINFRFQFRNAFLICKINPMQNAIRNETMRQWRKNMVFNYVGMLSVYGMLYTLYCVYHWQHINKSSHIAMQQ